MKCDANCNWGEDATIFFSYIEEGKVRKVNLCKQCASEKGVDDPTGYSLIDMLQGMGDESSSGNRQSKGGELSCGDCGFTQSDFKKTGRFGCAKCYDVFSEGLESLLEAMHKNTEHTGKVPSFIDENPAPPVFEPAVQENQTDFELGIDTLDEITVTEEINEDEPSVGVSIAILKDKLDVAVSEEDYEAAARIRDEISKLELENPEHS